MIYDHFKPFHGTKNGVKDEQYGIIIFAGTQ